MILVMGSKNASSWSLRPWLTLKMAKLPFEEIVIPLNEPDTKQQILQHSNSGKVPILKVGEAVIWESLAICEYVAELAPRMWPQEPMVRALARSMSCEMHAGFTALRKNLPMDINGRYPTKDFAADVQKDIQRIQNIWSNCLERFKGDFLFGDFSIADAMFAPVVSRFKTYDVKMPTAVQAYADHIWALPPMQEWIDASAEAPAYCSI